MFSDAPIKQNSFKTAVTVSKLFVLNKFIKKPINRFIDPEKMKR